MYLDTEHAALQMDENFTPNSKNVKQLLGLKSETPTRSDLVELINKFLAMLNAENMIYVLADPDVKGFIHVYLHECFMIVILYNR